MIKNLQKKFIITAMTAITVLLVVLLGVINIANLLSTGNQTDMLLDMLSESQLAPFPQIPQFREENKFLTPPITEDSKMSAVYFAVFTDGFGNIIKTDISRIASLTEEEANEIATEVLSLSKEQGKKDNFKYKVSPTPDGKGNVLVFLDTSSQTYAVLQVMVFSCLAGILCWGLMLLLVVFLSKKAILPIAINIEKQKQFVTDAGHEIKTPLAIILANTEAMELHNGENKWSKNIREQVIRLNGLMQNLLTLAKIDEGMSNIPTEELALSPMLEGTLDMFCESAELKALTVSRNIQSNITLCANREHILRLLSILIDNAVKYSCENGTVVVTLSKSDKTVELSIKNTCDVLPECEPEKLFDRFYRDDSARTQKSGGYGIGLSAARAIAELYNGTVTAEYADENTIIFKVKI